MGFLAFGVNHKTAPLEVREQVAFAPETMPQVLQQIVGDLALAEVAIVSTCNRTELYCVGDSIEVARLAAWLTDHHAIEGDWLHTCHYQHWDDAGIQHLMSVASGLDSMVLGEPQILGQIKSAYMVAREAGVVGSFLERLFQATFNIAKQVRTETAIGQNPVSVAYAAVSLAQHIFADLSQTSALLIGAGKTIDLAARHLVQQGVKDLVVANRTLQRAEELALNFGARAVMLSDIPDQLVNADIVIASTASQLPILGKGAVERALKKRKHRPIYMVDIAVPRDIEPEVGELKDVYLYSVDDLQQVISENQRTRVEAASEARALIEQGVAVLGREIRALEAVDTLISYRHLAETLRDEELAKALRQLESGKDPAELLKTLARGITNKLVHQPSIQLKKASAEGRDDVLQVARELWGLDDHPDNSRPDSE